MSLRSQAIKCFKSLHRARKFVFQGDARALYLIRLEINKQFQANKSITEPEKISELIKYGFDVETELRTTVIQAKEVKPGVFEANIHPDIVKLDNKMFDEELVAQTEFVKKSGGCCKEKPK